MEAGCSPAVQAGSRLNGEPVAWQEIVITCLSASWVGELRLAYVLVSPGVLELDEELVGGFG